mgnify:CR=1 FL=1
MTITTYYNFAIFPKRCGHCHRLFIFEHYDIINGTVLVNGEPVDSSSVLCKNCSKKLRNKKKKTKKIPQVGFETNNIKKTEGENNNEFE